MFHGENCNTVVLLQRLVSIPTTDALVPGQLRKKNRTESRPSSEVWFAVCGAEPVSM